MVVTDKAGNEKESNTITAKTLLSNKAPVISSTSLNSKTTNSITINARATDANGDKITYELYTSTSSSSGFSRKATSAQTTSGNQVSLTATGLSQYTTYYYYIIAKDSYTQTKGSTSSVRTYCSGTGLTCNGPFSAYVNCYNCSGTGEVKCQGSIEESFRSGNWVNGRCDSCGGQMSLYYHYVYYCSECGTTVATYDYCFPCGNVRPGNVPTSHESSCKVCSGTGKVNQSTSCSHGKYSSHSYCSHGYTSQHD